MLDALARSRHLGDGADPHRGAPVGREEQFLDSGDLGSQRHARVDDEIEEDREACGLTGLGHRLDARGVEQDQVSGRAVESAAPLPLA